MSTLGRKLALGSAVRGFNLVANAAASLLLMPFIVHKLGDHMYGIWTLVATFVGYYGLIDLGLSSAVNRYLSGALGSGDPEECNRIVNTALRVYFALSAVVLVITGIAASAGPLIFKNPADATLFWKIILIVGISVALMFPTRVFQGVLEANLRFDRTACFDLLALALRTVLIVVTLRAGYKVLALAWITFACGILSTALNVYFSFKDLPFLRLHSRYWRRSTAGVLFSYGGYSLIANLANILRFQIDNIVVAGVVGVAAVTHYSIAGKMAEYFLALMMALMGVFNSVFSRQQGSQDFAALKQTFFFASKLSVCTASFIGFGLIAWGKPFIDRWMGPRYLDAYPCLAALAIALTTALWQMPSVSLLYAISKHKFLALSNCIEGVVNVILSVLLARKYGIVGVATGTLIPMAISKVLIQPIYVCKVADLSYLEYMRTIGRTVVVSIGLLSIPLAISIRFSAPDYKTLFQVGLSSFVLYLTAILWFEFSQRERKILREAIVPRMGEQP